ncbi:unnamed protein product [Nesidiocoris tenuis]|uniref:Uncharacterized protein n=1 Tax=Nesidiocoris tenuis TaxID=355587 RepID=A0A6H5GRL3_9HEMI|nr:unnamed protein product [Nesidiocoris tenuis]
MFFQIFSLQIPNRHHVQAARGRKGREPPTLALNWWNSKRNSTTIDIYAGREE